MTTTLNRRVFTKTMLAGLGAAAMPSVGLAQSRKLQIGCTSLIWGALPRTPANLEPALRDMHELGYHKAETFASILEDWDSKGTAKDLLAKYPIPLISVYATMQVVDPAVRKDELARLSLWANVLKKYGGRGYSYVLEFFLPELRRLGLTDAQIDALVVENPRRILTFVAPEPALDLKR